MRVQQTGAAKWGACHNMVDRWVVQMAGASTASEIDLETLYRTERVGLLRLAMLLTQDRSVAEDIVHDAFTNLQARWGSLEHRAHAAGYLRVSVVNGSRTYHRRRKVRWANRAFEPLTAPSADSAVIRAVEYRTVVTAVRQLPKRQQQMVALRYWGEMSDGEIAAGLGVSIGTVKSTISRGLATVGRAMERELRQ